ncbi:MAG: tetratricopeptide repeat protein [Gammaproteobacteria bacterium]|nr:tetratricopeptide repeat protein [Gammaproteobacteria bacterium]
MQPDFRIPPLAVAVLAILILLGGCGPQQPLQSGSDPAIDDAPDEYVGSASCGSCHEAAYEQWRSSHHAQALQVASLETIRAPLNQPGGPVTLSAGEDDIVFESATESAPLSISHTFGVEPLQQYLVPTERGRLQALRWAWDSRAAKVGGGRWFQLYPEEEIPPGDVLHWRAMSQNWNSMCADCHSTALRKNYDAQNDSFDSQFAELSVGCEACHGPGSKHAQQPDLPLPTAGRLVSAHEQPQICAPCHSRRSQLREGFTGEQPLLDYYLPALLNPPLYHADGQILDEVYVYGSFVSSKMNAMGVVCSNCHEPHSAELRISGNATCTQCHSAAGNPDFPTLTKQDYATSDHHFHADDSPGSFCTDCHMPARTYMVVDDRHDHSFRIPRPDLAATFGTPSACQSCHADKTHLWAAGILEQRFGKPAAGHFSEALVHDATTVTGETKLAALAIDPAQPAITRASALQKLSSGTRNISTRAINKSTRDGSELVRYAALGGIGRLNDATQRAVLQRALKDPVAAVRMEAARQIHTLVEPAGRDYFMPALQSVTDEYIASQILQAERPEAHVNLAVLRIQQGDTAAARTHLEQALKLNHQFIPALINLADLLRAQGHRDQAFVYLNRAAAVRPLAPEAGYALAMWYVRGRDYQRAVDILAQTHHAAPRNVEVTYAYALALNTAEQADAALAVLQQNTAAPGAPEPLLYLYATIARDQGRTQTAIESVQRLLDYAPNNPGYQTLWRELQTSRQAPTVPR